MARTALDPREVSAPVALRPSAMPSSRSRIVTLRAVWALFVASLLACQSAAGTAREAGRPADVQPAPIKRLNAAVQSDPTVLSSRIRPLGVGIAGVSELEQLVAAGLTVADEHNAIHAVLAEEVPTIENGRWRLLPDGRMETTWVIRENARWHDGAPLTSADLLFTLDVVRDREVGAFREAAYDMIEGADAPDPRTVTVRWKEPYIEADNLFSSTHALPLPQHLLGQAYAEDKTTLTEIPYWNQDFVAAGPFRVAQWEAGSGVLLRAFDGFALGRPKIDEIDVRFIPNSSSLSASILAGAVDLTIGRSLSVDQAIQVRDRWQSGKMDAGDVSSVVLIYPQFIDPDPAVIGDVRFRAALMAAIDRQEMAESLQAGLTSAADVFLVPGHAEFSAIQNSIVRHPYDQRQATEAIASLGYARGGDGAFRDGSGARLGVEIRTSQGDDLQEKALFGAADAWQRVGVGVTQVLVPPQQARGREYRATFPGFDVKRQPGDRGFLERVFSAKTPLPENDFVGNNYNRYRSPDLDALLGRYFATIPFAERTAVLGEIVHHMTDRVLYITLFYQTSPVMIGNQIRGVTGTSQGWNANAWEIGS
ncbi:MAG TPA: ABC transporter substrate-binding protein [Chloroflexota bacterium]|nr:ABC transporter substrate-binding protein [Chloroflexota bacterium]